MCYFIYVLAVDRGICGSRGISETFSRLRVVAGWRGRRLGHRLRFALRVTVVNRLRVCFTLTTKTALLDRCLLGDESKTPFPDLAITPEKGVVTHRNATHLSPTPLPNHPPIIDSLAHDRIRLPCSPEYIYTRYRAVSCTISSTTYRARYPIMGGGLCSETYVRRSFSEYSRRVCMPFSKHFALIASRLFDLEGVMNKVDTCDKNFTIYCVRHMTALLPPIPWSSHSPLSSVSHCHIRASPSEYNNGRSRQHVSGAPQYPGNR